MTAGVMSPSEYRALAPPEKKHVSTDALVAGVIQGLDLGAIFHMIGDIGFINAATSVARNVFETHRTTAFHEILRLPAHPPETVVGAARTSFTTQYRKHMTEVNNILKLGLGQAGAAKVASEAESTTMSMYGQSEMFNTIFGIPYSYVFGTQGRRYWQKYYHLGRPSVADAYIMKCKGLLSEDLLNTIVEEDMGYTAELRDKFIQHLDYDPSPMEMLRLTDLMPLSPAWVDKKLKAVGMAAEERAVYGYAIKKRMIRDELTRLWGSVAGAFAWGLFTVSEIAAMFTSWDLGTDEKQLRQQTLDLERSKNLLRMKRDTTVYLFRKDKITDFNLYNTLVLLGIVKEIVNAIVALEDAKKGIVWTEIP